MTDDIPFLIQFYRQWTGDTGIPDEPAAGLLDHVKAVAQARLEALSSSRTGIRRPRIARILALDTRTIAAAFRLTNNGPVEIPAHNGGRPPVVRPQDGPRLRLID